MVLAGVRPHAGEPRSARAEIPPASTPLHSTASGWAGVARYVRASDLLPGKRR